MPPSKSTEINKIENLMLKGSYYEALDLMDEILEDKKRTSQDKTQVKFLKGKTLSLLKEFEKREELFDEALIYLSDAEQECREQERFLLRLKVLFEIVIIQNGQRRYADLLITVDKMDLIFEQISTKHPFALKQSKAFMHFSKAWYLWAELISGKDSSGDVEKKSIQFLKKSLKIFKELDLKNEIVYTHNMLGDAYFYYGHYLLSIKEFEKALKLAEKVDNKYWQSFILGQLAGTHWSKGDIDLLPDFIKKVNELNDEIGNKYPFGWTQNFLGIYYAEKGDWDKALEFFKIALKHYLEHDQKDLVMGCYNNIGVVFGTKGEIDKSIENYYKAQKMLEETGYHGPSLYKGNIAWNLYLKGELDEALRLLKNELILCEKFNAKGSLASNLFIKSAILWQQGKTSEAIKVRERCLKLREELGNKIYLGLAYGSMITFYVETDQYVEAKQYLDQFKAIVDEVDNKPVLVSYRIAEALVLKISENHRDRIKAEALLEQILVEDLPYSDHIDVLLNLCELLLSELQLSNDESILPKVKNHIKRLYDFAASNNSHLLTVEALWLQSQIALIELDVKKARELLQKSQKIIEEKGLGRLSAKITHEKDNLEKLSDKIIEAGKKTLSISKRMELVNVQNTVKEIRKQRLVEDSLEDVSTSKKIFSIKI